MIWKKYFKPTVLTVLTLPLGATAAQAAGVDAGTRIENTASASFTINGTDGTTDSNTVEILVDELLDVAVTSLDGGPITSEVVNPVLSYTVTNTGNGPEAFDLSVVLDDPGNDFDATLVGMAVDTNSNGVYDAGVDTLLGASPSIDALDPDESATVFLILGYAPGLTDGDSSDIKLVAEAQTGTGAPGLTFAGQGEGGGDAVVGTSGADDDALGALIAAILNVSLVKSAVIADPFGGSESVPGATITYTISAQVTGTGTANNLVVNDAIPAGTTFAPGSIALDLSALTDASDADEGSFDGSQVSVDLGDVGAGTNHSISFDVTID